MNVGLPWFAELRGKLREVGIPATVAFGRTQDKPAKWVVAINRSLPFSDIVAVLRVATQLPFEGFELWDPVREAGEEEDVLFGGYGDSFTPITADLRERIAREQFEAIDLAHYVQEQQQAAEF